MNSFQMIEKENQYLDPKTKNGLEEKVNNKKIEESQINWKQ